LEVQRDADDATEFGLRFRTGIMLCTARTYAETHKALLKRKQYILAKLQNHSLIIPLRPSQRTDFNSSVCVGFGRFVWFSDSRGGHVTLFITYFAYFFASFLCQCQQRRSYFI